ncbi:hypothetical protein IL306_014744 [Fusarium sp. DS 682]|nr:hypothetical protein IL306_014744 [Fusarium sp. DS 682]
MSLQSFELNDHAGAQGKVLADLLKTGDYSDLVISCGKDRYPVHKAIVCPQSHFFKVACDGKFKEAHTGTIELPDDDPVAVRMMIEYLYHHTYSPPGTRIHRETDLDAHLSDTEYDDKEERSKMELYGVVFIGNKRIKKITACSEVLVPERVRVSQPVTAPPPAPPPPSHQPAALFSLPFQQPAAPTPVQPQVQKIQLDAISFVQEPIFMTLKCPSRGLVAVLAMIPTAMKEQDQVCKPRENGTVNTKLLLFFLHTEQPEKYGIEGLKAVAVDKFEFEDEADPKPRGVRGVEDFIQVMREAYTSTVEEDRPLRDAVVRMVKAKKILFSGGGNEGVPQRNGFGL